MENKKNIPSTLIIALGANYEADANMIKAHEIVCKEFDVQKSSRTINTKPIGMAYGTPDFANMIIVARSDKAIDDVASMLKDIETICGNTPQRRANGLIAMDVDVLWYDESKFHKSDWDRWYIKQLLDELDVHIAITDK